MSASDSKCSQAVCSCRLLSLCNYASSFPTCPSRNWKPILICKKYIYFFYSWSSDAQYSICLGVIILIFLFAPVVYSLSYFFSPPRKFSWTNSVNKVCYLFVHFMSGFLTTETAIIIIMEHLFKIIFFSLLSWHSFSFSLMIIVVPLSQFFKF